VYVGVSLGSLSLWDATHSMSLGKVACESVGSSMNRAGLHHISANGMFLDYFDRNILKEGTEDNIEVPETTGDKEIHSIRYWLNDSNYDYVDTVDGVTLIRNRDTSFDHYFSSYSNFFEWLTNEEYELYKKNGPN